MSRQNFQLLLKKYQDGQCTDAERQVVESWFSLLDDEEAFQKLSKADLLQVENRLWSRLQNSISAKKEMTTSPAIVRKLSPALRVAAVVFFLAVAASLLYFLTRTPAINDSNSIATSDWIRKINSGTTAMKLSLEDGSTVELAPNSTLSYLPHFASAKRDVKLEGTAFFQVAKDSLRPFTVHSKQLMTQVLGTSFWVIYDEQKKQSSVEVVSGKVAVFKTDEKGEKAAESVLLTPNEKAVLNPEVQTLTTTIVTAPVPVVVDSSISRRWFVYDEAPLSAVLKDLEDYYAIAIELSDDRLKALQFTGNLSPLDYHAKLRAICRSLQLTYQVTGNRILLTKN